MVPLGGWVRDSLRGWFNYDIYWVPLPCGPPSTYNSSNILFSQFFMTLRTFPWTQIPDNAHPYLAMLSSRLCACSWHPDKLIGSEKVHSKASVLSLLMPSGAPSRGGVGGKLRD